MSNNDDRLNRVQIDLRVKFPELRYTNGGKALFKGLSGFSAKAKDDDPKARKGYVYADVNVLAWDDLAETLGNQVNDGDTVRVTNGYLKAEAGYYSKKSGMWTDPRLVVVATEAHVLDPQGNKRDRYAQQEPAKVGGEDIPFHHREFEPKQRNHLRAGWGEPVL